MKQFEADPMRFMFGFVRGVVGLSLIGYPIGNFAMPMAEGLAVAASGVLIFVLGCRTATRSLGGLDDDRTDRSIR